MRISSKLKKKQKKSVGIVSRENEKKCKETINCEKKYNYRNRKYFIFTLIIDFTKEKKSELFSDKNEVEPVGNPQQISNSLLQFFF